MKTAFQILLLLVTTVTLISSQTITKDEPLAVSSSQPCDTIIDLSIWGRDSNCCSLNRTDGGGCILSVTNGRCKVSIVTIESYIWMR
jgi:hypothetical protein